MEDQTIEDQIDFLKTQTTNNFLLVLDHIDDVLHYDSVRFYQEINKLLRDLPNLQILVTCRGSISDLFPMVKKDEIIITEME